MKGLHTTMLTFLLAVGFVVPGVSRAKPYEFELIARTGDSFGGFQALRDVGIFPSINNSGMVVFSACFNSGGCGVFRSHGGVMTTLDSGGSFGFGDPVINHTGTVAYATTGRIVVTSGGSPTILADTAGQFATLPVSFLALNDSGTVAFWATLDQGGSGIFTGGDGSFTAIATSNMLPQPFLQSRTSINSAGTVAFYSSALSNALPEGIYTGKGGNLTTIADSGAFTFFGDTPSINDAGTVLFAGYNASSQQWQLMLVSPDGTRTELAAAEDGFAGFYRTALSESGIIAFEGFLPGPSPRTSIQGLFVAENPAEGLVTKVGDTLEFKVGNSVQRATLSQFTLSPNGLNDKGQIVFWATLSDGTIGIFRANPLVTPGMSPEFPVLPCSDTSGTFVFCEPATGLWYDPPIAQGFTYELVGDGDEVFTVVMVAPGFFDLAVIVDGVVVESDLDAGETFIFGPGVSRFSITGLALDTAAPHFSTAFPTFLRFKGNPTELQMTAILDANVAPVANAGLDQTVQEREVVRLDGSGSSDLDGDSLTYTWEQIAGTPAPLDLYDPVHPTFTAPNVAHGGETLSFRLTVFDGALSSTSDAVDITVKDVNHPPVADAGSEKAVQEGSPVVLDGSQSYDIDNDSLTYRWVQTTGSTVPLSGANTALLSFTAPLVGPAGETLTFALTVSDGLASATDTVALVVSNVNQPPIAHAGSDQTKDEGSTVTLDGTQSSDPDMDALTYSWTQSSGPPVTLAGAASATPTFAAPLVGPGGTILAFRLIISDGSRSSAPDTVTVTVLDVNDPPACNLARATPAVLWPPNHKLMAVGIVGVADPNNSQVTIQVTGVTQDEPVNGLGDGDTSPDAVLQGHAVLLRAERAGRGNGRVYEVTFTADDGGVDGRCTGTVTVCVPHDRQDACIDDRLRYDSLQP